MYVVGNPLRFVDPSGHRLEEGTGMSTCGGICTDKNGYAIVATQRERHQIRNNRRRFMNALAWVPYLDTGEDLAVLTTGCGFSCQAGYEKPVGTGWRIVAGAAIIAPIGFRPAKSAINAITDRGVDVLKWISRRSDNTRSWLQGSFFGKLFGKNTDYLGRLPKRPSDKGPTHGILIIGGEEHYLKSGKKGPANNIPSGSPGYNAYTKTHVEGHASALMRRKKALVPHHIDSDG